MPAVFLAFDQAMPAGAKPSHVRIIPFMRLVDWLAAKETFQSSLPVAAAAEQPTVAASAPVQPSLWTQRDTLNAFLKVFERGLTPLFAILMFIGYFAHWRLFHRSDFFPLLCIVLAIAGGIWVHIAQSHLASSRYALSIVLLSTSNAALGVFTLSKFLASWFGKNRPLFNYPNVVAASLVTLVVAGVVDATSSNLNSRRAMAELGRWIERERGPGAVLVGSESQLELVAHYAHAKGQLFPPALTVEQLTAWIDQVKPDFVIFSARHDELAPYESIVDKEQQLGFAPIASAQVPGNAKGLLVLERDRKTNGVVHQAARQTPAAPPGG